MEVKSHVVYNIEKSAGRIQEILDSNNSNYEDKGNVVPSRDSLTYNNGYYVNVTALFIDIVGSSKLIEECQRPTLAKIYRSFISECVAIISSTSQCREVSINGDFVWGIFVNNACHLANKAGRNGRKSIIVTNVIYSNLNEHNQSLLSSYYDWEQYSSNYEGNVINTSMEEWINNN